MRELYERLKEENEQLLRQLEVSGPGAASGPARLCAFLSSEAARAAAERWKQKYLELQNKPAEVQAGQPQTSVRFCHEPWP